MTRSSSIAEARRRSPAAPTGSIHRIAPAPRSDEALLAGIAAGDRMAAAALLDRYGPMVERLIRRILGHDPELADLVHDAFATILTSIHQVREADAVKGWIAAVAAHTAHRAIRKRRASRWLCFWKWGADPLPEPSTEPPLGPRDALRRMYAALDKLPADERVAFALRYIDEMGVQEIASICDVSAATIKRRLNRAERRFLAAAKGDAVLRGWIEEGDRWTDR
ncbi:MAG: sigma-70 family RNA polymerase sigma factor [Polyangiaceae bacterium]|nr:sigma-70 family RNA polymerase sigma factor [Polyangiaceae bacterium]NUQ77730.1 sigma-70 family RNA polymerase sigma factor [Polyangiaceae bacterium]